MRPLFQILTLLLVICISIAGRHFCAGSPRAYFVAEAMNWVMIACLVLSLIRNPYARLTAKLFLALTCVNLLDEISQYPSRYEPWEYLAAAMIFAFWIREWYRMRREQRRAEDAMRPPRKRIIHFKRRKL